jgi:predicted DNA-binding antitoxin AbrB/MazE fold protein
MALEVEATYEDGVLKPERPLPLRERQRVTITVQEETAHARITYGLIAWKGDPETLRKIAEDPELRVLEYP